MSTPPHEENPVTYTMTDGAYFSSGMLSGSQAVAGYIGGPNAYRVWTDADWKAAGHVPKLPIWVPAANASTPDARTEVIEILNVILHYAIPRGQAIAFDLEASQADVLYMRAIGGWLEFFGYGTLVYGSESTLGAAAPPYLWRWDAEWTGVAHLTSGAMATQWESNAQWDTSTVSAELYARLLWR